jgi:1-aminocyclopropane-1-carboxylate deaminase/D-cysteine desulfhydrase-like pyridoxal-dependent ACC family enzyme
MTPPGTVFPVAALSRDAVHWEDYLDVLTPVTAGPSGVLYKREDQFAPLGYGGINGAKLRQLIYLVDRRRRQHPETDGILTGASVLSPQNSMTALVGAHYRLPVTVVLGATRPDTAPRHENVAIARDSGAEFIYTKVGFNPALQRAVSDVHALPRYRDHYRVCYGITTPGEADDAQVEEFHAVGARQAANIPPDVRTLVMTAGSCNSAASVLYGLARRTPPNLRRVVLIGIGPDRVEWMRRRLEQIRAQTGTDTWGLFTRRFHHRPQEGGGRGPILLEHFDLHATGWTSYQQRRPWDQDGIAFHPTYEGKAMAWLHEVQPRWWARASGDVLFWIVGSAGTRAMMAPALRAVS